MKTISETISLEFYHSKAFSLYTKGARIAVFDIETTGLSPGRDKLMLSGILQIGQGEATVIQYFSDQAGDEPALIQATVDTLSDCDLILTYNGRSFDLPFLKARAKRYHIDTGVLNMADLDLFQVVSHYSDLKSVLGSLTQKTLEGYLGIAPVREDTISGKENIALYREYMTSHDNHLERKILLHNHDDIIQLARLLPILEKTDFHLAMLRQGYPAGDFVMEDVTLTGGSLELQARKRHNPMDYILFPTLEMPCHLRMSKDSGLLEASFPVTMAAPGVPVIDALQLLGETDFQAIKKYPAFQSGYLILKNGELLNAMDINIFLMAFLQHAFPG